MRNVYMSYELCKLVYENSKPHRCEDLIDLFDNGCDALGVNSAPDIETILSLKRQQKKELFGIKITPYNYISFQKYAEGQKYIKRYKCKNDNITLLELTDKGLKLTDNVFLPYTSVGLWKEIWKEHKVFFTIVPTLITSLIGSGIFHAVGWISSKL